MGRREQALHETRQRIVEATVACHAENGILATSYEDIARRADVALATVHRHFPTLNDLVVGCGSRVMKIIAPPQQSIFKDAASREERLTAYVEAIFAFWARSAILDAAIRDAAQVPALQEFLDAIDVQVSQLASTALGDPASSEDMGFLLAVTDFFTWKAFERRGLAAEAPRAVSEIVLLWLNDRAGSAK